MRNVNFILSPTPCNQYIRHGSPMADPQHPFHYNKMIEAPATLSNMFESQNWTWHKTMTFMNCEMLTPAVIKTTMITVSCENEVLNNSNQISIPCSNNQKTIF